MAYLGRIVRYGQICNSDKPEAEHVAEWRIRIPDSVYVYTKEEIRKNPALQILNLDEWCYFIIGHRYALHIVCL